MGLFSHIMPMSTQSHWHYDQLLWWCFSIYYIGFQHLSFQFPYCIQQLYFLAFSLSLTSCISYKTNPQKLQKINRNLLHRAKQDDNHNKQARRQTCRELNNLFLLFSTHLWTSIVIATERTLSQQTTLQAQDYKMPIWRIRMNGQADKK